MGTTTEDQINNQKEDFERVQFLLVTQPLDMGVNIPIMPLFSCGPAAAPWGYTQEGRENEHNVEEENTKMGERVLKK